MAETVCIFPLTKGFIALYGYSVIFKTLSPLGDSKLCFRLTKTGRFNGENAASRLQGYAPKSHLLFVYPNIVSIDIVCDLVFYFVPQIR